jgi:hypothetical protein
MTELQHTASAEELVEVYGKLSEDDLAKQINDDYSVILGSERANLPRALAIAPKLSALRIRAWGRWKTKFPSYNLSMSYETASVYLRVWEHWNEIKALAVKKGVDPTLLTIDAALPSGVYVQAGTEFDIDASWPPPTHACQPLDPDAIEAYWKVGPRFSEVEIWRQCFTNCARWSDVPVKPATTWWVKSGRGWVLHGGGENYGPKPPIM